MQLASSGGEGRKRSQVFNEINITPLTDIFLVLLIIMMVVAPMIQHMRQDITPPQVESGQPVEQGPLTVEVTQDGTFYVEGKPVTLEDLKTVLVQKADGLKEKNVIIRADKATKSGAVMRIFEAARDAQYEKVTVAGEPLSTQRQGELEFQQPLEGAG
jgi:biopolymer transport protein ExbD/biopolymer transport protein TolR